jgi:site-specific recombinase XerD
MPESPHIPVLLELMFGEAARLSMKSASERLLMWARAFDEWLDSRKENKHLYNDSVRSWKQLLELVQKPPWSMTRADIEGYRAWLEARKLAPRTVRYHITYISTFYEWCSRGPIDPEMTPKDNGESSTDGSGGTQTVEGVDKPGADKPRTFNPACGVYKHTRAMDHSQTQILQREEVQALLEVLRRDEWLLSKRDYAFFLSRLRLGVPFQRLQRLKWGQIQVCEKGKTKAQRTVPAPQVTWEPGKPAVPFPEEAWQAIMDYLKSAGRLGEKRPEDMPAKAYIFAPLADPLRVEASGLAGDWAEERYLSSRQLRDILQTYGTLAGISKEKLTLSALRYTAVMTYLETAPSRKDMEAFLGHPGKELARRYQHFIGPGLLKQQGPLKQQELPKRKGPLKQKGLQLLRERKPHRYRSEDRFAHGLYAKSQPEEELDEMLAQDKTGLDEEVQGLRKLMERVMWLQLRTEDDTQAAALIHVYLAASPRLAELLKIKDTFDEVTPRDNEILQFMNFCFEHVGMPIIDIHQLREGVLARDPAGHRRRPPGSAAPVQHGHGDRRPAQAGPLRAGVQPRLLPPGPDAGGSQGPARLPGRLVKLGCG